MRNFNQRGGSTGSPRGGSRFGGSRPSDRGPVTMHQAICSTCGKECEVPFRPTGDKPIYCNDCFSANRGGDRVPRRDFSSRPSSRPSFSGHSGSNDEVKKQLEFLGIKIDRLTKVVEGLVNVKPTSENKERSADVKEVLAKVTKKRAVKKAKV